MNRKRKFLSQMSYEECTQRKKAKNLNLRVGTVLRMTLRNFMCHSLLDVDFESNVNFICGRNGSGKSAILTGLIVGLGAKTSATNRGTSVKGFVKAGKSSASVEIVLNNEGSLAYKSSVYGDMITVQRNISASGNSNYKIKSAEGETISTRAKDVQSIAQGLNIQVDNPICILNQDTSRNFLSSGDPKMKYNLFNRATRLETLYDEYRQGSNSRENALQIYKEKQAIIKRLINEIEDLNQRIENHKNIKDLKFNLTELQKELLWSKVVDSEAEYNQHKETVEELKEKYKELDRVTTSKDDILAEIQEKVRAYEVQIKEIQEAANNQNAPEKECRKNLKLLKLEIEQKNRDKSKILREIAGKKKDMANIKGEINNFTEKLSAIEQRRLDNVRIIKELEGKIKEMQQMADTYQNEILQSTGDMKQKEDQMNALTKELHTLNAKHTSTRERIKSMKNESGNPLAPYGNSMIRLVDAIESNKNSFAELPRGPIGSYVAIKDKKWTVAIEGFIKQGGLLNGFCVGSKKDCNLLLSIMSKVWGDTPKPTILTTKFFYKVHNVSDNLVESPNECSSIYEAITVSDPVVMNCLIDQLSIESILLIPNENMAQQLLSNANYVPRNCNRGLTINGDQYYPDPNYKTYSSTYRNARYLQVDTADILRQYEDNLSECKTNIKNIETRLSDVRVEVNRSKTAMKDLQFKLEKCGSGSTKTKMKMAEIQANLDMESGTGNIQQLEQELQEIADVINNKQVQAEGIDRDVTDLNGKIEEAKEKLGGIQKSGEDLQERIPPLEMQIREQFEKRQELTTSSQFEKKRLQEAKKKIEAANRDLNQFEKTLNLHTQQATYLGERVDNPRAVPEIVDKLNEVKSVIRKMDTENENLDLLTLRYEEKKELMSKVKELMECISTNLKELSLAYDRRKRHYKNTRDYFEHFVGHCFERFLKMRQFKGSLKINFNDKTLDMIVIPQQGAQGITPTTNLSGGERSFSTVAFLYSLWQCLDFPFYFLDEFDVFMDKANRTKVMEILIYHAKTHKDTQFVFLTPQDLSFVNDNEVAVHRLEDPVRAKMALTQ